MGAGSLSSEIWPAAPNAPGGREGWGGNFFFHGCGLRRDDSVASCHPFEPSQHGAAFPSAWATVAGQPPCAVQFPCGKDLAQE